MLETRRELQINKYIEKNLRVKLDSCQEKNGSFLPTFRVNLSVLSSKVKQNTVTYTELSAFQDGH